MHKLLAVLTVSLSIAFCCPRAEACTSIRIKTTDGLVFYARTMEYAQSLQGSVMTVPAGTTFQGTLPDGTAGGLKWKTKHGFVGMASFGQPVIIDGVNDAGLAAGGLLFGGYAGYEPYKNGRAGRTLAQFEVINYILSQFATVEEVRAGLKDILVCQGPTNLHGVFVGDLPLHYTVHDATGESLVIEYTGGKVNMYDNPLGVMTNAPDFPWMRIYLGNFVNLSAVNADPANLNDFKVNPTGQGSGMLGLPGDFTPPNRFLRMVALAQAAKPVKGADAGLALIMNLINNVDIPYGVVRQNTPRGTLYERTQWTAVADTSRGRYYFRTYGNMNWRYVDVKKSLEQAGTAIYNVPAATPADYPDVTAQSKPMP